jgi:hypothetical protein
VGVVGCPVARVWYGWANVTPQQEADAEWPYASPDLGSNRILVVGQLATVTVKDHLTGHDSVEQNWFMINLPPFRGRVTPLNAVLLHQREPRETPSNLRKEKARACRRLRQQDHGAVLRTDVDRCG